MHIAFLIGTAGSGKSLLTAALNDWLKLQKQNVATLNLDPGAINLPYIPDVDVRDYVKIEDLMENYKLGPNGALIMASDLVADEIETLAAEVEELNPDLLLVDTPGQMELFAFRASGPFIAQELTKYPKAIIQLFDSVFCQNPINYVANLFLSAAVFTRFFIPQIHVLSKSDIISAEEVNQVVDWSVSTVKLDAAIEEKLTGTRRVLGRNIMRAVHKLGLRFPLIPVSAQTNDGMTNLNTAIERVLVGGDKFTY